MFLLATGRRPGRCWEKSLPNEVKSQENTLSEVNEIDATETLLSTDTSDPKDLSLETETQENNNQTNVSESFEQNQEDINPQIEEGTQRAGRIRFRGFSVLPARLA